MSEQEEDIQITSIHFIVTIGHPNAGKSSLVKTLISDQQNNNEPEVRPEPNFNQHGVFKFFKANEQTAVQTYYVDVGGLSLKHESDMGLVKLYLDYIKDLPGKIKQDFVNLPTSSMKYQLLVDC